MAELHFCGDFNDIISSGDRQLIPHIKRFMECAAGDGEFYDTVRQNAAGCGAFLESRGIHGVDPVQLMPLVEEMQLVSETTAVDGQDMPQARLWRGWLEATRQFRLDWCEQSRSMPSKSKRFDQWRLRQENRCHSQLSNTTNQQLSHTTIAFELSQGCSLQCPFCGLATEPLRDVFRYTQDNAKLWRDVLNVAVEHLGGTAGSGLCYWASDPSDNPDYLKFVHDFGDITGLYPQATTAAPVRNIAWTRDLLQFRQEHPTAADRFSILSTNMLRRVHAAFSADELALTTLIVQYSDVAKQTMAHSGRNRKDTTADQPTQLLPDHTIACCTGYLVNMITRAVRLISPCPPSDRWPLGYRVYAEGHFDCAAQFDEFISQTIDNCMPDRVEFHDTLAFRSDLVFAPLPQGFELRNRHRLHTMEGAPYLARLGKMIAEDNMTAGDIIDRLLADQAGYFDLIGSIQQLFDGGLLDDEMNDNEAPEVNADEQRLNAVI